MQLEILLLMFALGLCIGSFINVVIYRTLHGDSPTRGRSYCDHCKRQLHWYENIPLLSFLALRGKCRTCHKKIDWTYPVVEFITGVLFVWWASLGLAFFNLTQFPSIFIQPLFWLIVGILLVIIFFTDLWYGIIPDFATISLGILSILYRLFLVLTDQMKTIDFIYSIISALVAFVLFFALYKGTKEKGIGFGDVKFAPVMAFLLGFPRVIVGFFSSFMVGGLVGVVLLTIGKKKFGQTVPFGPFLIIGLIIGLTYGTQLWQWYLSFFM